MTDTSPPEETTASADNADPNAQATAPAELEEPPLGPKLEDPGELLHRQAQPHHFQDGRLLDMAFRPTDKDKGLLSTAQGSLVSAAAAHAAFLARNCKSDAVYSVSVGECGAADLDAFEQRYSDDPYHAAVDFNPHLTERLSNKARKLVLKTLSHELSEAALARGRQHPPADAPAPAAEPPTAGALAAPDAAAAAPDATP